MLGASFLQLGFRAWGLGFGVQGLGFRGLRFMSHPTRYVIPFILRSWAFLAMVYMLPNVFENQLAKKMENEMEITT